MSICFDSGRMALSIDRLRQRVRITRLVGTRVYIDMSSQGIAITRSLREVYPGTTSELQDKHTALYSLVHMSFSKAYEDVPEFYVCINRIIDIVEVTGTTRKVSMACENGIIIAVSRTYKDSSIFVNGKALEEELEFTCKGVLKGDKQSELADRVQEAIQLATEDISPNALWGGIIYFQSNLPKDDQTSLIAAFTLAVLIINNLQTEYTVEQIQQKLSEKHESLPTFTDYEMDNLLVKSDDHIHIPIEDNNIRFVIGELLPTTQEIETAILVTAKLRMEMQLIQTVVCNTIGIDPCPILELRKQRDWSIQELEKACLEHTKEIYTLGDYRSIVKKDPPQTLFEDLEVKKRVQLLVSEIRRVDLLGGSCTAEVLDLVFKENLESQRRLGLVSSRVEEIISKCLEQYGSSCCMAHNKYLVVLTCKQKFIWLFQAFKKKVLIKNGEQVVPGNIQHLLFSTGPCKGVAVLDLSQELWY